MQQRELDLGLDTAPRRAAELLAPRAVTIEVIHRMAEAILAVVGKMPKGPEASREKPSDE